MQHVPKRPSVLDRFASRLAAGPVSSKVLHTFLAADVRHTSAYSDHELVGRDVVSEVLAAEISPDRGTTIVRRFDSATKSALVIDQDVEGQKMNTLVVAIADEEGDLTRTLTFARKYPVGVLAREKLIARLKGVVPPEFWVDPGCAPDNGVLKAELPKQIAEYAPDITFNSPILMKPVVGDKLVIHVLHHASSIYGMRNYSPEAIVDGRSRLMFWDGVVGGVPVDTANIITFDELSRVQDLLVFFRPWGVVKAFFEGMRARLAGKALPTEFFELPALPR
jgi:hypothetical protein